MRRAVEGTTPGGPYSPGIVVDERLVFVSGQGPVRDGELVRGTIEEETRIVLENVRTVLAAAGASTDDVVRCGVFLADLGDFAAMNEVYGGFFGDPPPARTTVGALLPGIKVEIDCIAVLPDSGREG
ncbi:MAG: Rid family hydrolase [Solirubrobacterales bacterium]